MPITIELSDPQDVAVLQNAVDGYASRLQNGLDRTRRRLAEFEERYHVSTDRFLATMVAEDLTGGDLEYVEWAGEAALFERLASEYAALEHTREQLS